jgi:SAM-dependent methyltransferase
MSLPAELPRHVAVPTPDFVAVKKRQQATWASGDFLVIGTTLQAVGETLAEAADIRAGELVLDVTDAEASSYHDGSFDVALSTFGVMFAPDHARAAAELLRVVRPGGRIGLANWTPEGFIGRLFTIISRRLQPPPGLESPMLWGTEPHMVRLFGPQAFEIRCTRRIFHMCYQSPAHWLQVFRDYYGRTHRAFAALDGAGQQALASDITELLEAMNVGGSDSLVVPAEYLEIIIVK